MSELREILIASLTGLVAIVLALAIYGFLVPPFTDLEIQESFVDTWQVNALFTTAALAVALPAGVLSALLSWRGSRLSKLLAAWSIVLTVLATLVLVANHAELTKRTTRLTGQEFGGLFGLGLGPQ